MPLMINAHIVLDENRTARFAEFRNVERFDVHAAAVTEAIERLMGGDRA